MADPKEVAKVKTADLIRFITAITPRETTVSMEGKDRIKYISNIPRAEALIEDHSEEDTPTSGSDEP